MKTSNYLRSPGYYRKMRNLDSDDVLGAMGLQTRRSTAQSILTHAGFLAFGALLGAAFGMAFAPRRGEQIRREMREKAGSMKARVGERMEDYKERATRGDSGQEEPPPPTV